MSHLFVLLHHHGKGTPRGNHYDLLLQMKEGDCADDKVLAAFASNGEIKFEGDCEFIGLDNHRKLYLDFEGSLSEGRGNVTQLDKGEVLFKDNQVPDPDKLPDQIEFKLRGDKMQGHFELKKGLEKGGETAWIFRAID